MSRFLAGLAVAAGLLASTVCANAQRVTRMADTGGVPMFRIPLGNAKMQTVLIRWPDGSPVAPGGKPGLATAMSYLMSDGPTGARRGDLVETYRDLQAGFRLSMTTDSTTLSINAPPEHMLEALSLIKRQIDDPALSESRLARHLRERRAGAQQALLDGNTIANDLRIRALVPAGAVRRFLLADPESYDGVAAGDVKAWKQAVLARDTATVVTAGPMTADVLRPALVALLAGLPAKARAPAAEPVALRPFVRTILLERAVPQTIIIATGATGITPGLEAMKAEFALARMGGAQGRLFIALRERLGATYGASMGLDTYTRATRGVSIRSAVEHKSAAEVIATIREEYAKWREAGITQAEFDAYRSNVLGNRRDNRVQPGAVAGQLLTALTLGLPQDFFAVHDKAFDAVTREEVNAYIRTHFPETLGFIIVAPSADGFKADCVIKALDEAGRCGL